MSFLKADKSALVLAFWDTYLPKALGCVLTSGTLEDLGTTWVLGKELGHIIDRSIDDNPETIFFGLVLSDLRYGVLCRHFDGRWWWC
jgi:hypothetical protein